MSFYPIDPRGLTAVDASDSSTRLAERITTPAMLRRRQDSLRTLAETTDGLAMLNSNDLRKQLRRIADDLTSYYLLGYYSTNSKLDGKFRSIKVRSKRPGIEIRCAAGLQRRRPPRRSRSARAAAEAWCRRRRPPSPARSGTIESDARAAGPDDRARRQGEPVVFHRGPSTGNQVQPADGRIFPRSERIRLEMEAAAGDAGLDGSAARSQRARKRSSRSSPASAPTPRPASAG